MGHVIVTNIKKHKGMADEHDFFWNFTYMYCISLHDQHDAALENSFKHIYLKIRNSMKMQSKLMISKCLAS